MVLRNDKPLMRRFGFKMCFMIVTWNLALYPNVLEKIISYKIYNLDLNEVVGIKADLDIVFCTAKIRYIAVYLSSI